MSERNGFRAYAIRHAQREDGRRQHFHGYDGRGDEPLSPYLNGRVAVNAG